MRITFWAIRFLTVFCIVIAILATTGLLRARPIEQVITDSLVWGIITASIFIGAQVYHKSRGRSCALCGDMPEATGPETCAVNSTRQN